MDATEQYYRGVLQTIVETFLDPNASDKVCSMADKALRRSIFEVADLIGIERVEEITKDVFAANGIPSPV